MAWAFPIRIRIRSAGFAFPTENRASPSALSRAPHAVPVCGLSNAKTDRWEYDVRSLRSESNRRSIASLDLPSQPSFHPHCPSKSASASRRFLEARTPSRAACSPLGRSKATVTRFPRASASQTRSRKAAGVSLEPCHSPMNTQCKDDLDHILSAPGIGEHDGAEGVT